MREPLHGKTTASLEPQHPGDTAASSLPSPPVGTGERLGDAIGPYRLLEVIGEGGFGVVYLAERREPMVQRIALKIIKPGMDSKAVIARFEQERQALAVMDHPNVARILDGGVTPTGRPYFVMELVQGETITAFADRKRLGLRERLQLFIPVCEAVQHAHHKGLIHRDLKPSNVLVAEIEGKPVPKVIDFGVAKAIASEGWTNTAHTQSGVVIGTPEYMSPEQVAGEIDVDTRADVYSLGVLLYELLTGELPFDSRELRKAAMAEIQRIIREVTPPKPSTRLAQLAGARTTTIAEARSATRERLTSELRRELDWIPLMALRKERERRYASPQALADDVQRYLDGRPLLAAPDSRAYLARKFVRRNRGPVIAAAAVVLALTVGLAAALWQRSEAIEAQRAEANQRARADDRAAAAEKAEQAEKERADQLKRVSDFQSQMLAQIDTTKAGVDLMKDVRERFATALEKSGVPEAERTARVDALQNELVRINATDTATAMIDRTILKPAIEAIDEDFNDQPIVAAQLQQALADRYRDLGLLEAAVSLQTSALNTRRNLIGNEHPDTLGSVSNMGSLLREQGLYAEAKSHYREALDSNRRVLGVEHPNTLSSVINMGALLVSEGRYTEAEPYYREAIETGRRVLGNDHPSTLQAINGMGLLLDSTGRFSEAESHYREALEGFRRVLGSEHPTTLISINNLGATFEAQGRYADAEPLFREALESSRRLLGADHPDTLSSINNMGALFTSQGRYGEAESHLREAIEASRRVLGEEHPGTLESMSNLAFVLQATGRHSEAELLFLQVIEVRRRVFGIEHRGTLAAINNMGSLLQAQGRVAEAEPFLRESLEVSRRVLGSEHPDTLVIINNMGALVQALGRFAEAESFYRESIELSRRVRGEEHPTTLIALASMGSLLRSQGKLDEAEPFCREAMESSRRVLGDDHPYAIVFTSNMGALLVAQQRYAEAVAVLEPIEGGARATFTGDNALRLATMLQSLGTAHSGLQQLAAAEVKLLEAHPIFVATRGDTHKLTLDCTQSLITLYTAWHAAEPDKGYDTKAAEWQAKLDAAKAQPPPPP